MALKSNVINSARLALGGVQHAWKGRTPDAAYQSLIKLFCDTGGASSDSLSQLISMLHPPYRLPDANGVAGDLDNSDLARITSDLDQRGYHVFEKRLPDELCTTLLQFASNSRCIVRLPGASETATVDKFDASKPLGNRYDLLSGDVVNNPTVQKLMADKSFIAVAQSYLRCKPIIDVIGMWWNAASVDRPDSSAAQHFHFDMDRIKWLKFFIYLTDVTPESGPHKFIEGSHRTGGIPPRLLDKGYSRLSDEEVALFYPAEKFIEFVAPRGTIIAEDTRGLHKAQHVRRGNRLMLQLQFSNSLFGGYYPPQSVAQISSPALRDMQNRFPRLYSNYLQ